jgi:hypothetical protein
LVYITVWTFQGYIDNRGSEELPRWFEGLSPEDQAAVMTALEQLGRIERDWWRRPQFDVLRNMDGMGEVILGKIAGVQTRLVGFFGPGRQRHVFTIVLVVTKKAKAFHPKDWERTALRRREECEGGEGRTHVWNP